MTSVYVLTAFYGLSRLLSLGGMVPTIVDLWNGKPSACLTTWALWTISDLSVMLYALFVVQDIPLTIMTSIELFADLIVLGLRWRLR